MKPVRNIICIAPTKDGLPLRATRRNKRRNEKCSCESGLKAKHCCGTSATYECKEFTNRGKIKIVPARVFETTDYIPNFVISETSKVSKILYKVYGKIN